MSLMIWGTAALVAGIAVFGLVGWRTGRSALALIPAFGLVAFQAAMFLSDALYSRVPEDVQASITFTLVLSAVAELVGVLISRASGSRRGANTAANRT